MSGSTTVREGGSQAQNALTTDLLGVLQPFLQGNLQGGNNPFFGIAAQAAGPAQQTSIDALTQILNQGPQGLLDAGQQQFQQNLQFGLGALANAAPATRSSAFGNQAIDFATRQDNAFNLFAEQALQNFQGNQISAANQLAGISAQNQNAVLNPTIQLLLGALGQGFPDPFIEQKQGFGATLGQIATGVGGLALGGVNPLSFLGGGGGNSGVHPGTGRRGI
jgi:hypothetical protein